MASMGSLVVDLQANTRQFDQAIQRSRQTMTAFAEGTRTAATAAGTLNNLTVGTDTARQLQMATKQMGDLDRKSTRLNSSHVSESRMPSSA